MTKLERLIEERLDDLHATLYGRAYDLSQPESKAAAVKWLAGEVQAIMGAADILTYDGKRYEFGDMHPPRPGSAYWGWVVAEVE